MPLLFYHLLYKPLMFQTASLSVSRSIRNRYVFSATTTTDYQAREPVTVRIVIIRSDYIVAAIRSRLLIIRKFTTIDIFLISLGTTCIPTPRIIGFFCRQRISPRRFSLPCLNQQTNCPRRPGPRDCPGRIKKNFRNNKTHGFHCLTMLLIRGQ